MADYLPLTDVEVFFFLPKCDQAETEAAKEKHITLVQAEPIIGVDELKWLCYPPKWLQIDFVIGHRVVLGCQAQIMRKNGTSKWIQFVHTDPEELGMFKVPFFLIICAFEATVFTIFR